MHLKLTIEKKRNKNLCDLSESSPPPLFMGLEGPLMTLASVTDLSVGAPVYPEPAIQNKLLQQGNVAQKLPPQLCWWSKE